MTVATTGADRIRLILHDVCELEDNFTPADMEILDDVERDLATLLSQIEAGRLPPARRGICG